MDNEYKIILIIAILEILALVTLTVVTTYYLQEKEQKCCESQGGSYPTSKIGVCYIKEAGNNYFTLFSVQTDGGCRLVK